MIKIEEYLQQPLSDRQKHLDLQLPCDLRGGGSKDFRGLLAHSLDTTLPAGRKGGAGMLCHACNIPGCSNVKHLYWGTSSENRIDLAKENARKAGIEYRPRSRNHRVPIDLSRVEEELSQLDGSKRDWSSKAAAIIGISAPVVRRWIRKNLPHLLEK